MDQMRNHKPSPAFAASNGVSKRREAMRVQMRQSRNSIIDEHRNLPALENSENREKTKIESKKTALMKWQAERKIAKENEKKNKLKPFHSGVVPRTRSYIPPPPIPKKRKATESSKKQNKDITTDGPTELTKLKAALAVDTDEMLKKCDAWEAVSETIGDIEPAQALLLSTAMQLRQIVARKLSETRWLVEAHERRERGQRGPKLPTVQQIRNFWDIFREEVDNMHQTVQRLQKTEKKEDPQ